MLRCDSAWLRLPDCRPADDYLIAEQMVQSDALAILYGLLIADQLTETDALLPFPRALRIPAITRIVLVARPEKAKLDEDFLGRI
jgi:hypothetical protein